MRRLLAIVALVCTAGACAGDAGQADPEVVPAVVEAGASPDALVPPDDTEVVGADAADAEAAGTEPAAAGESPVMALISMPAPSGDPELDALGAEIEGLEAQLAALDAAVVDLEGTP